VGFGAIESFPSRWSFVRLNPPYDRSLIVSNKKAPDDD